MKNLLTKTALAFVVSMGVSHAQFDAEGTDYSNASVDEWVEDQSNAIPLQSHSHGSAASVTGRTDLGPVLLSLQIRSQMARKMNRGPNGAA